MYKKIERLLFLVVLIVTLTILSIQYVKEDVRKSNEEEAIEKFFKTSITGQTVDKREHVNTKLDYIAVLEIPEISLKKGLVSIESKYNDINYNIETLEGSVYPDKVGDLYLAAHSGTSGISFFKNLYKLMYLMKSYYTIMVRYINTL